MAVNLTISKTLGGSAPADSLQGGGTGYDFGDSEGGSSATPILPFYITHDGINEITNLAVNLQAYSDTYGGDYSPSADLAKIIAQGDIAATDSGLFADEDGLALDAAAFTQDWLFESGVGDLFTTRKLIPSASMVFNSTGTLVAASTPAVGTLGANSDNVLGDTCHFRLQHRMRTSETGTGVRQFDIYFSYNFTS